MFVPQSLPDDAHIFSIDAGSQTEILNRERDSRIDRNQAHLGCQLDFEILQQLQHACWSNIDFLLKNLHTVDVGYLPYDFSLPLLWIFTPSHHFKQVHSFVEVSPAQSPPDSGLEHFHWQECFAIKTEPVIS